MAIRKLMFFLLLKWGFFFKAGFAEKFLLLNWLNNFRVVNLKFKIYLIGEKLIWGLFREEKKTMILRKF